MKEILTLTLPLDPRLARLGRLVTLHFLRHNGIAAGVARSRALRVEAACRHLLRGRAGARGARGAVLLRMVAHGSALEVTGRAAGGRPTPLLRIARAARR
jgi:hypothetical protein